jgi:hypothetical protein
MTGREPAVDVVYERCAGIDISKADVKVCIRVPGSGKGTRRRGEVRTFPALTSGLLAMRDWLLAEGVTVVGMEATGSYWKPVFYLLENDMECWLLNARHMKAVPGRKTDVKDSEWIAKLVEHGLVRPSFVPPQPIRQLRDLTRYRTDVVRGRAREAQRLQNLLEDCGIKLTSVVSDFLGVSGSRMLKALIGGALAPWGKPRAVHDPGKALLDVALAVALGGDCLADVARLRCEPAVFGPVASDPTISRLIGTLAASGEKALQAIRSARSEVRHRAWSLAGKNAPDADGQVVIDLDGVLVIAHSDKEDAAPTWKKTYGHHPLTDFLDHGPGGTGEPVAALLRPGNAGSNTAPTTSPPPNSPWPKCPSTTGEAGRP